MTESHDRVLRLKFHGRIIDHLGLHMYQKPVSAIAELIANAWDADAENVELVLPEDASESAVFIIKDDGCGMSFEDCENRYLNVGWNRRGDEPDARSSEKNRPILGRKGIGKFAGFGIAEVIHVKTISKSTGELTEFQLDNRDLISDKYVSTKPKMIPVLDYKPTNKARRAKHGTKVTLSRLKIPRALSQKQFAKSMARRFLLHQSQDDFRVLVNEEPLPDSLELAGIQYIFPRDYKSEEKPSALSALEDIDSDGWGIEEIEEGRKIRWRFLFHKGTIDEEELRGITIFAKGKLAQKPFLFNLAGGLGGQHGVEYLTGQVEADFIDVFPDDVMSSERERIRWEHDETHSLLEWGQERVKELLKIWQDRRTEKRVKEIEEKLAAFSERLSKLARSEQKTIKSALNKLARVPTLTDQEFEDLGSAVLTAWEQGRLKDLISDIAEAEELSGEDLLKILIEAQVLTALNVAEAVKTKLLVVAGLKERIEGRELESDVRDYIANNPWLISPRWETFSSEKSVRKLLEEAAGKVGFKDDEYRGRVDLALSSGIHLLVLEFMRPGLKLDWDHINRFERYVIIIRTEINAATAGPFKIVTGYIIGDGLAEDPTILSKIQSMQGEDMLALDWETLFGQALSGWEEFLEALAARAPEDERLQALLEYQKRS